MTRDRYDVVIVGGGSAGCALANRLSADSGTSVLVLEAGHSDWKIDPFIHMPAALPFPIGSRLYDWRYETDPEPDMNGRKVFHARGKVLGGSSSINGMIFQRGNPMDYERWAAEPGMKEWDYAHCLPYFKRMETCLAPAPTTGAAATARWCWSAARPRTRSSRRSSRRPQEAGYPLTDDVNGYRQEGFARFDRNLHRGRRLSAARAYLHPVRHRKNLDVETLAMVTKVRFEGKRAVGVDYRAAAGCGVRVDAGEVILCGGAINTPQLLQLSGVGDESLLGGLGIDVVHHSPGVGENLQDHLEVYIQYASKQPVSIAPGLKWNKRPGIAYNWLFHRRGLGATNHFEGGGFVRGNERRRLPEPDVPLPPGRDPVRRLVADQGPRLPGPRRPDVRRHPRLGADQVDRPQGAPVDAVQLPVHRRPTGASGSRRSGWPATSSTSPRSRRTTTASSRPGRAVETDEQILEWVRDDAETALHPSCTAAMGVEEGSVVDPASMRVHGLEGLRVVDASVFPYVTNGNIYAPVMMVAEKAADLIAGNTPLAPADVPWYRHGVSPLYPPGDPRNDQTLRTTEESA